MNFLPIVLKDTLLRFRDRRALIYMLAAPLLIGLIMGAAFGRQGDDNSPIYAIPVAVVNADAGDLGTIFVQVLTNIQVDTDEGAQPLFTLTTLDDIQAARSLVENGEVRGVLYLPPDFSAALQEIGAGRAQIHLYTDPSAQISPLILESVVQRIALGFQSAALGARLAGTQVQLAVENDPALGPALAALPQAIASAQADFAAKQAAHSQITLESETLGAAQQVNAMDYFMPSMAIFFLMFSMFAGTRSILNEEKAGTLARLMTTPTSPAAILLGKISGTLLTGLLQMAVLVLVSAFLFGVDWGAPLGVVLMTLTTVTAAAGLGALVAAFARDDNQAGILGTVFALVFGVLGGNFIVLRGLPTWLDFLSKATINRWALDGFTALSLSQASLSAILPNLLVLSAMGILFFALSLMGFRRRFVR